MKLHGTAKNAMRKTLTTNLPGHIRLHVREEFLKLIENLVKDRVGRLVASQTLLRQVLVRLGQALDLKQQKVNSGFWMETLIENRNTRI